MKSESHSISDTPVERRIIIPSTHECDSFLLWFRLFLEENRKSEFFSLGFVARRTGISKTPFSDVLAGRRKFSLYHLSCMFESLRIPVLLRQQVLILYLREDTRYVGLESIISIANRLGALEFTGDLVKLDNFEPDVSRLRLARQQAASGEELRVRISRYQRHVWPIWYENMRKGLEDVNGIVDYVETEAGIEFKVSQRSTEPLIRVLAH